MRKLKKNSFGKLLGELVYRKRKTLGLTQMQLAEDAFGSTGKTRRISELESGLVANPHPKTIDPIIVTLGINNNELAECAAKAGTQPDENLERAYTEASALIEGLAKEFEHSNQDASLQELGEYLSAKAREYVELKTSILKLQRTDEIISEFQKDAIAALSEGNYSLVDKLLKEAEETQQNSETLEQIGKLAQIRILRGDNRFLEGDLDTCFKLYEEAALFFKPFNQEEMVFLFEELARRIYETGRRSLEPSYWVSQKLLEVAISNCTLGKESETIAGINYRLSLISRNQAAHANATDAEAFLKAAIKYAREAVKTFSQLDDLSKLLPSQISLGNSLSDLTFLVGDPNPAKDAIDVFEDAKIRSLTDKIPELLGHINNGLGAAILRQESAQGSKINGETLKKAMAAYSDAITASTLVNDPEIWGVAHINIGNLLAQQADLAEKTSKDAAFIRLRSISCFLAAIETYPSVKFPHAFAEAHFKLAEVLLTHGLYAEEELIEFYLVRAINSYHQACEFHTEETHPAEWAYMQCRLGSVFGNHARVEGIESAKQDIEMAISYFEEGKRVFGDLNDQDRVISCNDNISCLRNELTAIDANDKS